MITDQAQTINQILITYPYIWKWKKAFSNYLLNCKGIKAMNTAIFVEILAYFANSTGELTVSKLI